MVNGYGVLVLSDKNVSELDRSGGCTALWFTKCHPIIHFKIVNFMLYELHLKKILSN